ncbi:LacI family transcriptional regulator OS=Streptomyces fumanus OX=67302 GN=GCM10018772_18660 PE=4 SV=1 [Streptomyces fumanus]
MPTLTSVAPDKEAIARAAVALLLARVDRPEAAPARDEVTGHRLVVRESSGGPARPGAGSR